LAPGAFDALSARLIQEAGAEAVYFTGAGFANSQFAVPDVGLTTMTETVEQARRIVSAVEIPVIADADTGYGGVLNVARTIRELESAGVAAIQLEDQAIPKRCGHFDRKSVVSIEEMIGRVRAACDARRDPSVLIIARTDARQSEGLDCAIERANAYAEAGADLLFIEAPLSIAEVSRIPPAVRAPAMLNLVEGGSTPIVDANELERMGFRLVIYANTALRVAAKAVGHAMSELLSKGTSTGLEDLMLSWDERQTLVRLKEYERLDERFSPPLREVSARPPQP
jgi:2-methylisocitrate lyase-like PEP mutase family enzyme